VEVGLLGPLEVAGPEGRATIGGAKERLVLALLALRAGEVVSRDALVDALWGEEPPATAVKTLQGHVARVRRSLEGAGMGDVLATRAPGYLLSVPADSIDVTGFERHATAGRGALAEGDASSAAVELAKALGLWRGDALADCRSGGWAATQALRLDELRLSTVEDRIDADLMLGQHAVLAGELESLVARHPLRERLWAALMISLYRSGRQAEAVRAYQRARDILVEELGLEPGLELRRLEAAVLAGDAELDPPDASQGSTRPQLAVPVPGRIGATTSAVFVGRVPEREGLGRSLMAVAEGERRVALVSGEPGIGKTSLCAAVAREASGNGAVVLYGRCDEDLGIPYQPWAEMLAHLVAHAPDAVLAAHVDERGIELARLAPELGRRAPGGRVSSIDAGSERYLLFGAVVDLLVRVSALAPVVLVLDDLHWADRPTIQLLLHVASADGPLRLAIIGTFRDSDVDLDHPLAEALAALHRESGIERLALRGLADDELLSLLETTARHAMADEGLALRDALSAETDGNPFFVGEMLRHLAETGAISEDEHGHWIVSADLRTSGLPVSIREVIGRRVALLGEPSRDVLSTAAVIGRDFDADVLARVAELGEGTVIDGCDQAVAAALLIEGDGAGRYTFSHALIEHALYEGRSAGWRGRIHRRVAEALEALCGDDPTDRIGELAYHWARATQPPDAGKAIAYAQQAGDRALAQLAPDEALRWYREALDLLDRAPGDDRRSRAQLLLGLGDAQRQTGDPAHRETLFAAGRLADDVDAIDVLVRSVLRNSRGWMSKAGGVDHARIEMLELALNRLDDADSPDRARLLALLSVELTWDAEFDDRFALAAQAVDMARRTGDDAALVDAIRLCNEAIAMPQTLPLRLRWNREACALADTLGDPTARLHANDYLFLAGLEAGDPETMRISRAILHAEAERIGQPIYPWVIEYHDALDWMIAGDLDAAEQASTNALTLGAEAGYPEDAVTIYGGQLMTLRWMQGRVHDMLPLIEEAASHSPDLKIFRAALALARVFDDQHDEVCRILDTELAADFRMFADATWLAGQVLWAEAVTRCGHQAASTVLYRRLLPWHDQFATTHTTAQGGVAHFLGRLAHTLDLHDEADAWFSQALAFHEAMEAPFFVAMTQASWAGLLADRGQAGDGQRARALASTALPVAQARGYGYVERDARSVLERIG
jgi:DNA-binding SARP family transcriptional activator/tetratricopeptide (TPR) repeat protein